MMTILANLKQNKFNTMVENFMSHHPYVTFLALFIGMPLFILIAVFVCTTSVALPIALVMEWI